MVDPQREVAFVVSETHWDREWYHPFQEFRYHLVFLVQKLLDLMQERPDYRVFVFDGQSVVIPDVLEVAPEMEEPLRRLSRAGRIRFGPWYVLPDEFLVSAESLVRNLHYGHRIAEKFGGAMNVGYVPDGFGHPAQLPQVLAGFGIRRAILWRGMGEEAEDLGSEFLWEALDGTQVLAVWLPQGYGNFGNLGYPRNWGDMRGYRPSLDEADRRLGERLAVLRRFGRCGVYLLMNGLDHLPPQPELPDLLRGLQERHPELEIRHASFEELFDEIERRLPELPALKIYQGEFNSGKHAVILQGVYSSRVYLKQANFELETKLVHSLEPLLALALTVGGPHLWRNFLDYAWRELMKNHPHDDICGCSVDAVHRNNEHIYEQVRQVVHKLEHEVLHFLGWQVRLPHSQGTPFVVWNTAGFPRSEWVRTELWFDGQDPAASGFRLELPDGREVPYVLLETRGEEGVNYLTPLRKRVACVWLKLPDVPPGGWQTIVAVPGTPRPPRKTVVVDPAKRRMENEFLLIDLHEDGTFDLQDKRTGNRYERLHWLEDTEDVGDEYDYSPAPNSLSLDTKGVKAEIELVRLGGVVAEARIRRRWELPARFDREQGKRSDQKVPVEVQTILRVVAESPRVDIETEVHNRACDHRLRVHFPTGVKAEFAEVDEQFALLRRRIALPLEKDPVQPPSPTRHFQRFVSLGRGGRGLALVAHGLHEYEATEDGDLALTLFRSVGWLSRNDLLTRKGHAGWAIPTPEAQCLRTLRFSYALLPHEGEVRRSDVYNALLGFVLPIQVARADWKPSLGIDLPPEERPLKEEPAFRRSGVLPDRASLVKIEGEGVVLSSLKPAWRGEGIVVRVYSVNTVGTEVRAEWLWPLRHAFEVNLNEEYLNTVACRDNEFRFHLRPGQIRTFLVIPEVGPAPGAH
ncbi:MAG: glycosyl hydrolase-related protein [candidate division KSB1 bacterium]|nr:glycosyl hydrolase-related protein [candidate division KSB1 bacterium]